MKRKMAIMIGAVLVVIISSQCMTGSGMMNGWGGTWSPEYKTNTEPITIDQAVEIAEKYLSSLGNSDLALAEIMEFSYNFYAEVEEKSTGIHAFELLMDRYTGSVYPEPGPNMMWNTKYGHMMGSGMMGSGMMGPGMMGPGMMGSGMMGPGMMGHGMMGHGMMGPGMMGPGMMGPGMMGPGEYDYNQKIPIADMPISSDQALDFAQQFLNNQLSGTKVTEDADIFYGYYTIHVLKENKIYGMLSVNGHNGQILYHSWHGDFIDMKEFHD